MKEWIVPTQTHTLYSTHFLQCTTLYKQGEISGNHKNILLTWDKQVMPSQTSLVRLEWPQQKGHQMWLAEWTMPLGGLSPLPYVSEVLSFWVIFFAERCEPTLFIPVSSCLTSTSHSSPSKWNCSAAHTYLVWEDCLSPSRVLNVAPIRTLTHYRDEHTVCWNNPISAMLLFWSIT